jgi:hypothetical protein
MQRSPACSRGRCSTSRVCCATNTDQQRQGRRDTLEELARQLGSVDLTESFLATVAEYKAVQQEPFSPVVKDGRGAASDRAIGRTPSTSRHSRPTRSPAVSVPFGGVKIAPDTNVQNVGGRNIRTYAAGEMIGGFLLQLSAAADSSQAPCSTGAPAHAAQYAARGAAVKLGLIGFGGIAASSPDNWRRTRDQFIGIAAPG